MKLPSRVVLLFLAIVVPAVPALADEPCIPDGTTANVSFDRPSLGSPGFPVAAQWIGSNESGSPLGWEYDPVSSNDAMGAANPCSGLQIECATLPIENKGGNLSGPNGEVQNGIFEGSCIEVFTCWTFRFPVHVTRCVSAGLQVQVKAGEPSSISSGGQIGIQECREVEVWMVDTACSATKDICPC